MNNGEAEIVEKILRLKTERNAIILVHNYQLGEVQDIADFLGDSLELSRKAAETDADVIVFCGVHFMAETAYILSPDKTVILPEMSAGCPMADMVTPEALRKRKEELPDATVVTYVNSSAAVKAESDVCCTSANAVKVVESVDSPQVLFVPDQNLGHYIARQTGKQVHLWPGFCSTHMRIRAEDVQQRRREHPNATVIVHPECRPGVIDMADEVLSTGGLCRYVRDTDDDTVIVGTEIGILHRLRKENPRVRLVPASEQAICPRMKLTTLENVLWSLQEMAPRISVSEDIRVRAKAAVDRMLAIGS
jgi:quinolinate synthase